MRAAFDDAERAWQSSPLAAPDFFRLTSLWVLDGVKEACSRIPAVPVLVEIAMATDAMLQSEDVEPLTLNWPVIDEDASVAVELRKALIRRKRWAGDFEHMAGIVRRQLVNGLQAVVEELPESCFEEWEVDEQPPFSAPLVTLFERPAAVIEHLYLMLYDDETLKYELFLKVRERLVTNMLVASGFPPDTNPHDVAQRMVMPTGQKNKNPVELAEMYLAGTPFAYLMSLPVPFHIPDHMRFEHCHIIGGTGHGKTQLMQRMVHADLLTAQHERRSIVVIDSQGDLINKLSRLSLFDPDAPGSLADRLVLIDPSDVEFPASLNLFDAHTDRVKDYGAADRERVLNGVIELYETFFGEMLGAELTQKQGVIFRYLARLMMAIPGATIHTLMQIMEDGKPFKSYMQALDGSARYFFESEFFHPSFSATKKQILKRLWGVLSTPAFERMFAQKANKLDMFEALQSGKIILVSTAKDMLKSDGSSLLGRFFIGMLAQATLERSTLTPEQRTPTFVYVDEAQEYFDDSIETLLNQARKYKVGITLAHQTLDQLSPRLRSAVHANTSFKCVGGVSSKDARALADELRTSSDFIEGMRRRGGRSEFAVWLKQSTPHAIRLSVQLGYVERQSVMSEESFAALTDQNRARYCGTKDDVIGFAPLPVRSVEPERQTPVQPVPVSVIVESEDEVAEVLLPSPSTVTVRSAMPGDPLAGRATEERGQGKGGSQHQHMQKLIKEMAQQRGYRAVIEEPVAGGSIDVAFFREGIAIACEISVTSKAAYEVKNLAKCLGSEFTRVFAIATDRKRLAAIEAATRMALSETDLAKIDFLTPDGVAEALDALSAPVQESTVRGYNVKVTRSSIGIIEAQDRRASVTRIIAKSMQVGEGED